jgi:hypothetical protein
MLGLVQAAITGQEHDDVLALAHRMKMDDIVSHALQSCPCVS